LDKDGRPLDKAVEVVRDAQGNIIGTLVDGKVVGHDGKVIGVLKDGHIVDAEGNILHRDVSVSSENATSVAAELRAVSQSRVTRSIKVIDFIAGGSGKDGITPVNKVRVE